MKSLRKRIRSLLPHRRLADPDTLMNPAHRTAPRKRPRTKAVKEFNGAVNFDLKAIFVAVPKTGTTSVREQISPKGPYFLPFPHLSILQIRDALYAFELMRALRQNKGFPTGAVSSDADIRARARATFESFFKFSSVRNPWARAVSLYYRSEGVKVSEKMSFAEFCEHHVYASDTCLNPTLHRNQIDWITDEEGRIAVDYVYKIEEFAQKIDEIRDRSGGRLRLAALQSNVNARSRSGGYRDLYDDHTRGLIARHFERDIDSFGYVF
jgi:hypothetical protein